MKIILTKLQSEILRHRLVNGNTLSEVLGDEFGFHEEDIEDIVKLLLQDLTNNSIDTHIADFISEDITKEVLIECIEGSTWIGSMIGNESEQKIAAHLRSLENLANKIGGRIGKKIMVPNY